MRSRPHAHRSWLPPRITLGVSSEPLCTALAPSGRQRQLPREQDVPHHRRAHPARHAVPGLWFAVTRNQAHVVSDEQHRSVRLRSSQAFGHGRANIPPDTGSITSTHAAADDLILADIDADRDPDRDPDRCPFCNPDRCADRRADDDADDDADGTTDCCADAVADERPFAQLPDPPHVRHLR